MFDSGAIVTCLVPLERSRMRPTTGMRPLNCYALNAVEYDINAHTNTDPNGSFRFAFYAISSAGILQPVPKGPKQTTILLKVMAQRQHSMSAKGKIHRSPGLRCSHLSVDTEVLGYRSD